METLPPQPEAMNMDPIPNLGVFQPAPVVMGHGQGVEPEIIYLPDITPPQSPSAKPTAAETSIRRDHNTGMRKRRMTLRDVITQEMPSRRSHGAHGSSDPSLHRLTRVASQLSQKGCPSPATHIKTVGSVMKSNSRQVYYSEMDRLRDIERIRQMPVSMAVKRQIKESLNERRCYTNREEWTACFHRFRIALFQGKTNLLREYHDFLGTVSIWRQSFKKIEGHFGFGVVTYFYTLKWLLKLNVALALVMFFFLQLPQLLVNSSGKSTKSTKCTKAYTVTESSNAMQIMTDIIQGTGVMEKSISFYGGYDDRDPSSNSYSIPAAYLMTTAACLLISLVTIASKVFKRLARGQGSSLGPKYRYPRLVLVAWDYSVTDAFSSQLKHKVFYRQVQGVLADWRARLRHQLMSDCDWLRMLACRVLVHLAVCVSLGVGCYVILVTVKYSGQTEKNNSELTAVHGLLIQYMTPLTITALNVALPFLFQRMVRMEDYSPARQDNVTLLRIIVLRFFSLGMLMASLASVITCKPRDSCNVPTEGCVPHRCWETYVGQELYKLAVLDLITTFGTIIFVDFPRKLLREHCPCKLAKAIPPQEFNIPKNLLHLMYAQCLLWLGMFFSPIIPVLTVFKYLVFFCMKRLTVLHNYSPSNIPYRSSDSRAFFLLLLLFSYLLSSIPIYHSLWTLSPSLGCGPFREFSRMIHAVGNVVQDWPSSLQAITSFLFSTSAIIPLVILLILLVHYYRKLNATYRTALSTLAEQVAIESQDKEYFISELMNQHMTNSDQDTEAHDKGTQMSDANIKLKTNSSEPQTKKIESDDGAPCKVPSHNMVGWEDV